MSGRRLQLTLQPQVLWWARERAGLDRATLAQKVNVKQDVVQEWETSGKISMAQVDKLAQYTHTPLGFLFLPKPADDSLPIPDFRTADDKPLSQPSPDLIETVQQMQRRQDWLRDELIEQGQDPVEIVGVISHNATPVEGAETLRKALGVGKEWANDQPNWTEALRFLRSIIENTRVMVVSNGVVGNSTRRKLDPAEFRGFALVDKYAPLIFINSADAKAAQLFTLTHELAHVCINESGISNFDSLMPLPHPTEQFCNAIAAEFLVPASDLESVWESVKSEEDKYQTLARRFKVSSIVAARRALDLKLINLESFIEFYKTWQQDERREQQPSSSGGNFWNTQNYRIGRRLGEAVVRAVKEGRLLYREAYSLTGLKGNSFDQYIKRLEGEN